MESWTCIDYIKVVVSCKILSSTRLLSSRFNKAIPLAETANSGTLFSGWLEKHFTVHLFVIIS